ncbi:hypothetical protein LTR56_000852 [Elasticomyces elasticus]|nr:hypothetical protein LTR22_018621 [Elasticomyces elasticus]KAK3660476.1 hypothetical protein LTR56_000852 [Elasticomyces elasticus]KAK4912278.1 hypothetical protein LTR49_019279 [Elasticomyces elasticus]KAK5751788.1 hypothetical protein LTS12_018116 [Elasticomyces elasticus]
MSIRRSKRVSGQRLSNRFDEIETAARHRVLQEKRTARQAKYAEVTCKFNFFDLLPEIRQEIYCHAMQETRLNCLSKAPALAMVSKRIRAEVLPLFFRNNQFRFTIISNHAWMSYTKSSPPREKPEEPHRRNGNLSLRFPHGLDDDVFHFRISGQIMGMLAGQHWTDRLREREGTEANFRDVYFRVIGINAGESYMYIRVPTASKLKPVVSYSEDADGMKNHGRELTVVRERARVRAEVIAEREGFLGYTLKDMEAIAAEFRYWPEQ